MSKNRTRLAYDDMDFIESHCRVWINILSHEAQPGKNFHNHKCIASVLEGLKTKVERKKIGVIPKHGYTLRINESEIAAILHMRNERGWMGEKDNAIFRLLKFNNV